MHNIFLYDLSLPLLLSELPLILPLPFNGDSGDGCVDEDSGELIILNHYDIAPTSNQLDITRRRPLDLLLLLCQNLLLRHCEYQLNSDLSDSNGI